MMPHIFTGSPDHGLVQSKVVVPSLGPKVFLRSERQAVEAGRGDVHLHDTQQNGLAEIRVRDAAAAVEHQRDLDPAQRLKNLQEAFAVAPGRGADVESVILVDDIYTTGSTVEACTRVLKAAGVRRVYFVAVCIGKGR